MRNRNLILRSVGNTTHASNAAHLATNLKGRATELLETNVKGSIDIPAPNESKNKKPEERVSVTERKLRENRTRHDARNTKRCFWHNRRTTRNSRAKRVEPVSSTSSIGRVH